MDAGARLVGRAPADDEGLAQRLQPRPRRQPRRLGGAHEQEHRSVLVLAGRQRRLNGRERPFRRLRHPRDRLPPLGAGDAHGQARRASWGSTCVSASPSPSWPDVLAPQHQTVSSSRRAQVCGLPAASCTTFVTLRATGDAGQGRRRAGVFELAELAVVVGAPAQDGLVGGDGARVGAARRDAARARDVQARRRAVACGRRSSSRRRAGRPRWRPSTRRARRRRARRCGPRPPRRPRLPSRASPRVSATGSVAGRGGAVAELDRRRRGPSSAGSRRRGARRCGPLRPRRRRARRGSRAARPWPGRPRARCDPSSCRRRAGRRRSCPSSAPSRRRARRRCACLPLRRARRARRGRSARETAYRSSGRARAGRRCRGPSTIARRRWRPRSCARARPRRQGRRWRL